MAIKLKPVQKTTTTTIDTCRLRAGDIQELLLKAVSSRNDLEASCILTNPDNPAMSLITIGDIDNPLH